MPENQPQVRIFNNLRDRFEDGGLIYTPNFSTNTYNDLSEASEYDPISDGSDKKQPDNPQGQPDSYSRLDGIGTDGIVNKYYDGDIDPATGINPTEYDANIDPKDRVHPYPTLTQNYDYSRLDLVGEKPVSTDANGRVVQHYYEPEGPTYLQEFESRTGTFQGYE